MVKIEETPDGAFIQTSDAKFTIRSKRSDELAERYVRISIDVSDMQLEHVIRRLGPSRYESKCLARHLVQVADAEDDGS